MDGLPPLQPRLWLRPFEFRLGLFGQSQEEPGVTMADGVGLPARCPLAQGVPFFRSLRRVRQLSRTQL